MPYKCENIRIEGTQYDRRRRLTDDEKERIRQLREADGTPYYKLAQAFGVSKSLVIYICRPDILERQRANYKERRKDGRYYHPEKHKVFIPEHRRYKKRLYDKGLID